MGWRTLQQRALAVAGPGRSEFASVCYGDPDRCFFNERSPYSPCFQPFSVGFGAEKLGRNREANLIPARVNMFRNATAFITVSPVNGVYRYRRDIPGVGLRQLWITHASAVDLHRAVVGAIKQRSTGNRLTLKAIQAFHGNQSIVA